MTIFGYPVYLLTIIATSDQSAVHKHMFDENPRLTCSRCTGNHTGYKQVKGTKASAQEISDLYQGLRQSYLTDFDVLLTGYAPSAAAVEAVGEIGLDLQRRADRKPGSFFWGKRFIVLVD